VPVRGVLTKVYPATSDVVTGLVRAVEAEKQERVLHLHGEVGRGVSATGPRARTRIKRPQAERDSSAGRTISALSNIILSRSSLKSVCASSSYGVSGAVVKMTSSFSAYLGGHRWLSAAASQTRASSSPYGPHLTVRALLLLVEGPEPEGADVAGPLRYSEARLRQ
jgi:hypothetical protein